MELIAATRDDDLGYDDTPGDVESATAATSP